MRADGRRDFLSLFMSNPDGYKRKRSYHNNCVYTKRVRILYD